MFVCQPAGGSSTIFKLLLFFLIQLYLCGNVDAVEPRVVEVGFVCDKEFSEIFSFDQNQITQHLMTLVQDAEVTFQTLRKTRLFFRLSEVQILSTPSHQPFVEASRFANGSTDLSQMYTEFGKWIYGKAIVNKSNIVMLITGSTGKYVWGANTRKVCPKRVDNRAENIAIFRLTISLWYSQFKISLAFATSLGAVNVANTSCKGKNWHMKYTASPHYPDSYYFSECNDQAIYNFVISNSASCLKTPNSHDDDGYTHTISGMESVSIENPCKIKYSNYTNVTTSENINYCDKTSCYQGTNVVGTVNSIYNTACGENKFCFRGRCLPKGNTLYNLLTRKCLYTSNFRQTQQAIILQSCTRRQLRFDQIMFNSTIDGGAIIVATNNALDITDKCLTVNPDLLVAVFDLCRTENLATLVWDLFKFEKSKYDFYLCHRSTLKCAMANKNGVVSFYSGLGFKNLRKVWRVKNTANVQSSMEILELYKPVKIVIRLLLACDSECVEIFGNSKQSVKNYWKFMIQDAHSKFQQLESFVLQFVVTEKYFLSKDAILPHGKNFTSASQKVFGIDDIKAAFDKWVKTEKTSVRNFDIAVLTSGKNLRGKIAATQHEFTCANYQAQKRILGTISMQITGFSNHSCMNLASAFSRMFRTTTSPAGFDMTLCTNQSCSVNQFGHSYFSVCDEVSMKIFFHKHRKCFPTNQTNIKRMLRLDEDSTEFPSFRDQCNGYTKTVKTLKQGTENCAVTNCYTTGIHSGKSFLAGKIFPIYRTPCGINKHCFQGQCINKGFQLQHFVHEMCITGQSADSYNTLEISPCLNSRFPTNELIVGNVTNDGFQLQVQTIFKGQISDLRTCLTIADSENILSFKPCGSDAPKSQLWEFLRAHVYDKYFMIYHHGTEKCVGLDSNLTLVLQVLCDPVDLALLWQYYVPQIYVYNPQFESTTAGTTTTQWPYNFLHELTTESSISALMYSSTGVTVQSTDYIESTVDSTGSTDVSVKDILVSTYSSTESTTDKNLTTANARKTEGHVVQYALYIFGAILAVVLLLVIYKLISLTQLPGLIMQGLDTKRNRDQPPGDTEFVLGYNALLKSQNDDSLEIM